MPKRKPSDIPGELLYNCEACRKARTRCDKRAPTCRRCVRLGLTCVCVPVTRGRPSKKDKSSRSPPSTNLLSVSESKKSDCKPNDTQCPAVVYQNMLLKALETAGDVEAKERVKTEASTEVRSWIWYSFTSRSLFMLNQAIQIAQNTGMSFANLADIFSTYQLMGSIKLSVWENSTSFRENISDESLHFIPNMSNQTAICQAHYFGKPYVFVTESMEKIFMSVEDALRDPRTGCPNQVFTQIVGDFTPFFRKSFHNIRYNRLCKFRFVKGEEPVDSVINEVTIVNVKVRGRRGQQYITDVSYRKVTSMTGNYVLKGIYFPRFVQNGLGDKLQEEEKGADLSPGLNILGEGIDDDVLDDSTDLSIPVLRSLFNENSADEAQYKEFLNFSFFEE